VMYRPTASKIFHQGGWRATHQQDYPRHCIFVSTSAERSPFSRMDLILVAGTCSSILSRSCRAKWISLLHYALRPGGICAGSSGRVWAQQQACSAVEDRTHKIFQTRVEQPRQSTVFPFIPRQGTKKRPDARSDKTDGLIWNYEKPKRNSTEDF